MAGGAIFLSFTLLVGCSGDPASPSGEKPPENRFTVSPDTLDMGTTQVTGQLVISSLVADTLQWTMQESAAWITIDPPSGALIEGADTVSVLVDRSALGAGGHAGSIWIDAGEQGRDTVLVSLEIPPIGTVMGHVYYAFTLIPVHGALVSVGDIQDVTGEDGAYKLPDVPMGEQLLQVQREGFDTCERWVQIPVAGLIVDLDMTTPLHAHTLSGQVTNILGNGINRVLVTLLNPDGSESDLWVRTATDGTYALEGVPDGQRTVRYAQNLYDNIDSIIEVDEAGALHAVELVASPVPPPPGKPTLMRHGCSTIFVLWLPRTEVTTLGYHVERAMQASGPFEDLSGLLEGPTTSYYEDAGLELQAYYYRVRTENINSRMSDPATAVRVELSSWVLLFDGYGAPRGRRDHSAILDAETNRMIIFGGRRADCTVLNDIWAFDLTTHAWAQLEDGSSVPAGRCRHSAIYDPAGDRMIVYGGYDCQRGLNDVWAFSLSTHIWTMLREGSYGEPEPQPWGRYYHSAIYDPVRHRMLVHGGSLYLTSDMHYQDTWAFDLDAHTWSQLSDGPKPRQSHVAAYDPMTDRMIIFGGAGEGHEKLDDTWAVRLAAGAVWEELDSTHPSGPWVASSAIYEPSDAGLVIYGGYQGALPGSECWACCPLR